MSFNFPSPATVGQLYPDPAWEGAVQYKWSGTAWLAQAVVASEFVKKSGDTMIGALNFSSFGATTPTPPTVADTRVANTAYVEDRANAWGAAHAGSKVAKAGDQMTGYLISAPSTTSLAAGSGEPTFGVRSDGVAASAAYMTFHRPGAFAANLGLDADNTLKWGGWSYGTVSWKIMHEGFAATAAQYRDNSVPGNYLTTGGAWAAAAPVTVGDAASITINLSTGFDFVISLGASRTIANTVSGKPGQKGIIWLLGGSVAAWGANWKFPGSIKPTSSGGTDMISYVVGGDGLTMYCTYALGMG
jgi:hypothetical protein